MRRRPVLLPLLVAGLLVACSSSSGDAADTTVATSTTPAATTTVPGTTTTTTVTAAVDGFPGAEWETGPLPAGVDEAELDAAVTTAFGAADNEASVRSVVAVVAGKIVYERYHPLDDAATIFPSWSVAKSFASAVIGLLSGDGKLDLQAPAPVEQWAAADDPRHAITIEDMLHMASGLDWTEEYSAGGRPRQMFAAPNAADFVAELPLVNEPGSTFAYSTGTSALLAGIITDTLGGPDATDTYVHERLLDPIGITTTEFQRDPGGVWLGGLGADHTARDFARFGLLYLHDGVWAGTRILPEGWVDYTKTPSPANPVYGAHWWMLHPDSFEARGLFGQIILVSPLHDLVLVITTAQGGDADTLVGALYGSFADAA